MNTKKKFGMERTLAKCVKFDFCIEDHGLPFMTGHFDYEDGGSQGFGYMVDAAFLMRLVEAVGVDSLRALDGKSCWVTHTHDSIVSVEPLHKKQGTPFVIADWVKWNKERTSPHASAYEMRTGKKP